MSKRPQYPILQDIRREYRIMINNKEFDFICSLYIRRNWSQKRIMQLISSYMGPLKKTPPQKIKVTK